MKNFTSVSMDSGYTVEIFKNNGSITVNLLDVKGYGVSHEHLSESQIKSLKELFDSFNYGERTMQLTDHENKPIHMNGEHPTTDIFGTTIDYGETYYITPNEEIVHVLNVDEYFAHVMKCDVVKVED